MTDEQPFAGIKVVEFGQFISVPYCAQLLAEGGARVIKVESLDGDPARHLAAIREGESRHYLSRNRGKHILPLDLRHPRAAEVIDALVSWADVVLTNFRPGLAEQFGLDYESLSAKYPRVILGNVTAFGRRGPDALLAGMDVVVQARSGLLAALGREINGLPAGSDPSIVDYQCAMSLAFGVSAALFRRERTGRGGEVSASLLGAGMSLQNTAMVRIEADREPHAEALSELQSLRSAGASFAEQSAVMPVNRASWVANVYFRTFMTKDAPVAIACASLRLQEALLRATGLEDAWHGKPPPDDVAEYDAHYVALRGRMEAAIRSKTSSEWRPIFEAAGVPFSLVLFPAELLSDPQVEANELVADIPHPVLGSARVFAPPVRLDPGGFQPSAATERFGSEALALLREIGFDDEEARTLVESRASVTSFGGGAA